MCVETLLRRVPISLDYYICRLCRTEKQIPLFSRSPLIPLFDTINVRVQFSILFSHFSFRNNNQIDLPIVRARVHRQCNSTRLRLYHDCQSLEAHFSFFLVNIYCLFR